MSSPSEEQDGPQTSCIKKQLLEALNKIQPRGDFATFHSIEGDCNPGLYVQNIGTIDLPLSPHDATVIIDACHRSPFGKESQTLVDTSVRKCWELDATQYELRNPKWQHQLRSILTNAAEGLGVFAPPGNIRAERYKLLIYEEGAFFLAHQDSPKTEGMFGTLVVCLPSKHEGGEVYLTHNGESRVFKSSQVSEFEGSYAAWYSDVTHEIKPVTSGYRLVLTYNLVDDGPGALRFFANPDGHLESAMEFWKSACDFDQGDCPDLLVYPLDHKYPSAHLGFRRLKGIDQERILQLQSASKQHGFYLFLGNMEREVQRGADGEELNWPRYHESNIVIEDNITIQTLIDCDDMKVGKDIYLRLSEFVDPDIFKRVPDHEDYQSFTGNEGQQATHFYRETVSPRSSPCKFILFVCERLPTG